MEFRAIVRHSEASLGEGSPAFLRILMDHFTAFVIGENYVNTNYTGSNYEGGGVTVLVRDELLRQGSMMDIMV